MTDLLAAGGVLLFLDQWSKRLVRLYVAGRCVSWGPALRIRRVTSAREIYARDGARVALVVVWFIALVSATILYNSGTNFQTHAALWGVGAALGGAAGNLWDVLRRRSIVDFIDLRWWPVFNVADIGIVGGLVVAFWPHH
jgi:signal peptidase II